MKIQYRIALIFALITICIALAVSVSEYYFTNQNVFEDFYKRLEIRAITAAKSRFEKEEMSKRRERERENKDERSERERERERRVCVRSLRSETIEE